MHTDGAVVTALTLKIAHTDLGQLRHTAVERSWLQRLFRLSDKGWV